MSQLTDDDVKNLLRLLARAEYRGIDEAEVGVVLKHKLVSMLSASETPDQVEESTEGSGE